MTRRFTETEVELWRDQGFVIIPEFFNAAEIAPVIADYEALYNQRAPASGHAVDRKKPGEIGAIHASQFRNFDTLPYDAGPETNLLSLHPALIDFSRALLGVEQVHCYQSHSWAKFTGEADFDQAFHCDFSNHTLTVPADEPQYRTVDFIIYLTDVTDDLGALHYVPKPLCAEVLGDGELVPTPAQQGRLKSLEKSAAGPSGTVVAHGIDTLHRGTNLTRAGGHRFTMTTGYKAAGNEMIGFHVWQYAPHRPWQQILNHATPEQLEVLGIPPPGHKFWTPRTLHLTGARWPEWNLDPYVEACQ